MKNGQRALSSAHPEYRVLRVSRVLRVHTHTHTHTHKKEKKSQTVNSTGRKVDHFARSVLKPLKRGTAAPPAGERMSVGWAELKNMDHSSPPVTYVLRRLRQC